MKAVMLLLEVDAALRRLTVLGGNTEMTTDIAPANDNIKTFQVLWNEIGPLV